MSGKMFVLAALGAFAAATPAAAQWNGGIVDTQSLRAQIDDGVARGALSEEDAASLRSQLRGLANLQRQYAQDGLSGSEREDLRQRAQGLRNEIANAEGENPSYGRYGNGYGNSYQTYDNGRYAPYGNSTYDNRTYDNRTYGDRTYDNGAYPNRYGNGQYDEDEGYSDNAYRRDRTYDRDNSYDRDEGYDEGGYGLRVGDRVTGGLYAVPNAYRYRFRDGDGVYYRYGNGSVYQIDARTGVVLRIYPLDR